MNRIPRVRKWRVRYHMPDESRRDIFVATINKRFARWEARDRGGWGFVLDGATDETVSLVAVNKPAGRQVNLMGALLRSIGEEAP